MGRPPVLWLLLFALPLAAGGEGPPSAAVASAHPLATRAGQTIMARGGNAFDAAVAVCAALSVVEPYSSGLGGGGFWLLHRVADGRQVMVDGRERAPLAARPDMYLDGHGNPMPKASIDGALAAAIPGTPAALAHLAEHYGRLPLTISLAPAITLAEEGFRVGEHYRRMAGFRLQALRASPSAAAIFLTEGVVPELGTRVLQPDLAHTLRALADQGEAGFYRGTVARALVKGVLAAGGIWQLEDLKGYRIVEREPVRGVYRDVQLISASLPSSGGTVLMEMLNILSGYALDEANPATRIHLSVEAMRRAYRDRAVYLGDPDFVTVPTGMLLHPFYAAGLRGGVQGDRATPSAVLPGIPRHDDLSHHTTHFSILDRSGNRVAATLSINYPFGSGFVVPATGVLLNDEMDDFVVRPGTPNVYGLVGAQANAIAPGKRMLSSMSPTFLEDGRRIAILGTPGGSRIITSVLLATLDFSRGADVTTLVSAPRYHHQYLPDEIQAEPQALDESVQARLRDMGHRIHQLDRPYGNMQAIIWDQVQQRVEAASDPRGIGAATVH